MFGPLCRSRLGPQNVCASCFSRLSRRPDLFQRKFRFDGRSSSGEAISSADSNLKQRNESSALQDGKISDISLISKEIAAKEDSQCAELLSKNASAASKLSFKQKDQATEGKLIDNYGKLEEQSNSLVDKIAQTVRADNGGLTKPAIQKVSPSKKRKKRKRSGKSPLNREVLKNPSMASRITARNSANSSKSDLDVKGTNSSIPAGNETKNTFPGISRSRHANGKLPITYVISKEKLSSKTVSTSPPATMAEVESSEGRLISASKNIFEVDHSSTTTLMNTLQNGKLTAKDKKLKMAQLRDAVGFSHSRKSGLRRKTVKAAKPESEDDMNATEGSTPQNLNGRTEQIKEKRGMTAYEIKTIDDADLKLVALEKPQPPVPSLAYGLERVLFNPGVYHLRDPRSRVFNFDPYLQSIMPVTEFDFNALKEYITSSRDETLISTAAEENKKYTGSTSSMTSALAHFHFLLSQWRPVNISNLSQSFRETLRSFTSLQRAPSAVFLRWKNGTYAIDADKEFDSANILMMLGKSMEKLLTLPTEEFERYRKENSGQITQNERNEAESFHYTTMGDFLMRSQLDAYDRRIPGTGMFDLKTRAVVSIRMDAKNYQNGLGYEIRNRHGEFESYEREYYDMIRAAFLKYSLQVRMGRMDGIFVAFHNTERIFGFQYISLPEMDFALHGQNDLTLGDSEFKLSLELLNRVLDRATTRFPEQSLRLFFETRETTPPFMYIFAEPVTENEIDQIQNSKKAEIEEYERNVLGIHQERTSEEMKNEEEKAEWGKLQAKVEDSMDEDELELLDDSEVALDTNGDTENIRQHGSRMHRMNQDHRAIQEDSAAPDDVEIDIGGTEMGSESMALIERDLSHDVPESADKKIATSGDGSGLIDVEEDVVNGTQASQAELTPKASNETNPSNYQRKKDKQLLAMTLTIRNKVNGAYVDRPENLSPTDRWSIEYALAEVPKQDQSRSLYEKTQRRRARALKVDKDENSSKFHQSYAKKLRDLSLRGRIWREEQNELDQSEPYKTLKDPAPASEEKSAG